MTIVFGLLNKESKKRNIKSGKPHAIETVFTNEDKFNMDDNRMLSLKLNDVAETIFTAVKLRANQNAKDRVRRQEIKYKKNTIINTIAQVIEFPTSALNRLW